jgi:hypothetical protein
MTTEDDTAVVVADVSDHLAPQDAAIADYDVYHREYFDLETGKGPADPMTAENWWKYRRNRPKEIDSTIIDTPDGSHMLWEIEDTQGKLRKFIKEMN